MNRFTSLATIAVPFLVSTAVFAWDDDGAFPCLDRAKLRQARVSEHDRPPNTTPEVWLRWNALLRGVLANGCLFNEPEVRAPRGAPPFASGTYRLRWIDFLQDTGVPLTNLTPLARFDVDFDAGTVVPLPSPAPLSDEEALSVVTNRFPDAAGVPGVPPLVQRAGGITIVGIPALPDGRTDGKRYLYDPIAWIHDETRTIFEFCSQESDIPAPQDPANDAAEATGGDFPGWDEGGLKVYHEGIDY